MLVYKWNRFVTISVVKQTKRNILFKDSLSLAPLGVTKLAQFYTEKLDNARR